jgi:hypothetical protein
MKKIFLSMIAIAMVQTSFAQWTTAEPNIYNANTGNVGIGVTSPSEKLTIRDPNMVWNSSSGTVKIKFDSGSGGGAVGFEKETANTGGLRFYIQNGYALTTERMRITGNGDVGIGTITPSYKLDVIGPGRFTNGAYVNDGQAFGVVSPVGNVWANNTLIYKGYSSTYGDYAEILVPGGTSYGANIRLINNGNVGIGTTIPDAKLAVAGTIHSKAVKVDLTGWPDYVFKPAYRLSTLQEVKSYIDKNNHLPDMPSEQDVARNGINLGEIVKLQTKKIEELTLYMIEKEEQVKKQEARITALEKALSSLTAK